MTKQAIEGIGKIAHIKQSNSLNITKNGSKIQRQFFLYFDPVVGVWTFSNKTKETPLWQFFFFFSSYLFKSIYSGIVWVGKLHDFDEETCFL